MSGDFYFTPKDPILNYTAVEIELYVHAAPINCLQRGTLAHVDQ